MKKITFHNVANFIGAYWNKFRAEYLGLNWRERQFEWREQQVMLKSPGCIDGKCVHCKCDTPDKFWEPDPCESGCYPQWMERAAWEMFEKHLGVTEVAVDLTAGQINALMALRVKYGHNVNYSMFLDGLLLDFEKRDHHLHRELFKTKGVKTREYKKFEKAVNSILLP